MWRMEAAMFTGIVEEVGTLASVSGGRSGSLTVRCSRVLEGTKTGDSIAVSGICLTVTSLGRDSFTADVTPETLRRSTLGQLKPGSPVNLERAIRAGDRFGGHIVAGHIDGVGQILSMRRDENAVNISFSIPQEFMKYVIEKGSIAVDGISLTVFGRKENSFSAAVIPGTMQDTDLSVKHAGDPVNIECDCIGKYVEQLMGGSGQAGGLSMDMLRKCGFTGGK